MLFNSFVFPVFFLLVCTAYWCLQKNYKVQNVLLVVASYFFYGWWDWRFLLLLATSTVVDFFVAGALGRSCDPRARKRLVTLSLVSNLGILGFFKYFNFFTESTVELLNEIGMSADVVTLDIILPVGISCSRGR